MSESPYIRDVSTETFRADVMEASFQQPILVDFWAAWCEPCKQLTPVLEKLVSAYKGNFILAKVDCDKEQALAAQVGVRSLPTVMLVKEGQLLDQFSGALPEGEVRQMLEKHVPMPEASPREQARAHLEQGDFEAALPLLDVAHQAEPEDTDLAIDLARALFHSGETARAEALLEALPDSTRHDDRVKGMVAQRAFAERVKELPAPDQLTARLAEDATDVEARYQLALHLVVRGDYAAAMESLLQLLREAPGWNEDQARTTLLEVFNLLGPEHPLARPYRQKLFQLMY
ncbi:MAG: thioredoxin [Aquisalimonadaceae bacterium]